MTEKQTLAAGRRVLLAGSKALAAQAETLGGEFSSPRWICSPPPRGRIVCTGMGKSGHVAP